MKLYLIYKVADSVGIFDTPQLYAISEDKKLVSDFSDTRNMKHFVIKTDSIDKSDLKKYKDKYKSYVLGRRKYRTSSEFSSNNKDDVEIVSTQSEEENVYISSDKILYEFGKATCNECGSMKDGILSALNDLSYFNIYKFFESYEIERDAGYFYSGIRVLDGSLDDLNWEPDMLAIFLYYYKDTMKLV